MNIKKSFRTARCLGVSAIVSFLLAQMANAATHWYVQPIFYFGTHTGVYQDIAVADINQNSQLSLDKWVPITTFLSYTPFPNDSYIYFFRPEDEVHELFIVGHHSNSLLSFYMSAESDIVIFPGASVPTRNSFFLQTNSMLICPQDTFFSPYLAGTGDQVLKAEVDLAYCPGGGFPVQARAQYLHGMN